jgi:hypothetical protein
LLKRKKLFLSNLRKKFKNSFTLWSLKDCASGRALTICKIPSPLPLIKALRTKGCNGLSRHEEIRPLDG